MPAPAFYQEMGISARQEIIRAARNKTNRPADRGSFPGRYYTYIREEKCAKVGLDSRKWTRVWPSLSWAVRELQAMKVSCTPSSVVERKRERGDSVRFLEPNFTTSRRRGSSARLGREKNPRRTFFLLRERERERLFSLRRDSALPFQW